MEYQLIKSNISLDQELSAAERVLTNRGISLEDIKHYLNTTDDDLLEPELIANIKNGAEMLIKHIAANDKIFIQVDADCDGFTSAAILINYLNCLFPNFTQTKVSYRLHDGKTHGIIVDTIPSDVKLVIAPDSSSNQYEEHKKLKEQGIDVLVLDHHQAEKVSTFACVINNQLCNYPTKSLSGAGMVYKFCSYIDKMANCNYADLFLDLASLGNIADMMDLRDFETKHIVQKGLAQIRNPFFKQMIEKQSFVLKDTPTAMGVAFYVAPFINATVRVGTAEENLTLFESMLDYRAYELIPSTKRGEKGQTEMRVTQACRNCTNIKNRQTKICAETQELIETLIQEKDLLKNKILIVQLDTFEINKNLTGLIANQLMAKYQRPVLVLNKVVHTNKGLNENNLPLCLSTITWEGSGRGCDKSKLTDFKKFLKDSNLVELAEGHPNAFGAIISNDKIEEFIEYSNKKLIDFNFSPCYKVDFIYNNSDFNKNDIIEIADLNSLWGQGIEEPLVVIEDIKINKDNITLMSADKNPTLKINLTNGTSLIKFKASQEEYDNLCSEYGCLTINAIGRCEKNVWRDMISPQLIVEDYEIIKEQKYYF